eukprot:scaffold90_cov163-Ochromonas_danica.AAC.37
MNEEIEQAEIVTIDISGEGLIQASLGRRVGGRLSHFNSEQVLREEEEANTSSPSQADQKKKKKKKKKKDHPAGQSPWKGEDVLALLLSNPKYTMKVTRDLLPHTTVPSTTDREEEEEEEDKASSSRSSDNKEIFHFRLSYREVEDGSLGVTLRPVTCLPGKIPCRTAFLVTASSSMDLSIGEIIVAVNGISLLSLIADKAALLLRQTLHRRLTVLSAVHRTDKMGYLTSSLTHSLLQDEKQQHQQQQQREEEDDDDDDDDDEKDKLYESVHREQDRSSKWKKETQQEIEVEIAEQDPADREDDHEGEGEEGEDDDKNMWQHRWKTLRSSFLERGYRYQKRRRLYS